jgi:hypothetical protein
MSQLDRSGRSVQKRTETGFCRLVDSNGAMILNVHVSNNGREYKMIEMRQLVKTYRVGASEFHALQGIDLTIARGSFVAVVGKSGSGKSTLANLVTGIDRASSGSVRIEGLDLGSLDESGLARWRGQKVGVVFQSFQLLPTLTVLENVMLPWISPASPVASRSRARWICWRRSESWIRPASCLWPCPGDSSNASRSRAPWPTTPSCWWPTNPPATWIPRPPRTSWTSSLPLPPRGRPSCWSPTNAT